MRRRPFRCSSVSDSFGMTSKWWCICLTLTSLLNLSTCWFNLLGILVFVELIETSSPKFPSTFLLTLVDLLWSISVLGDIKNWEWPFLRIELWFFVFGEISISTFYSHHWIITQVDRFSSFSFFCQLEGGRFLILYLSPKYIIDGFLMLLFMILSESAPLICFFCLKSSSPKSLSILYFFSKFWNFSVSICNTNIIYW